MCHCFHSFLTWKFLGNIQLFGYSLQAHVWTFHLPFSFSFSPSHTQKKRNLSAGFFWSLCLLTCPFTWGEITLGIGSVYLQAFIHFLHMLCDIIVFTAFGFPFKTPSESESLSVLYFHPGTEENLKRIRPSYPSSSIIILKFWMSFDKCLWLLKVTMKIIIK